MQESKSILIQLKRLDENWSRASVNGLDPWLYEWSVFWRTGNMLDSLSSLMASPIVRESQDEGWRQVRDNVAALIHKCCKYFWAGNCQKPPAKGFNLKDIWRDDFGWWGLAFLKLHQYYDAFPSDKINPGINGHYTKEWVLQQAHYSQDKMLDNWNLIAKEGARCIPENFNLPPGAWNQRLTVNVFHGIQNTVTNLLFTLLNVRLYLQTNNDACLEYSLTGLNWIKFWTEQKGTSESPSWMQDRSNPPSGKLFLCRPLGNVDIQLKGKTSRWKYNIDGAQPAYPIGNLQFWTGDQGILLGILTEFIKLKIWDSNPQYSKEFFVSMLTGLMQGSTGFFDKSGCLHEAFLHEDFLYSYALDYSTGKGVFMRYASFFKSEDFLQERLGGIINAKLDSLCYQTSVEFADITPNGTNNFGFMWNGTRNTINETNEDRVSLGTSYAWNFVQLTNILDAMNYSLIDINSN